MTPDQIQNKLNEAVMNIQTLQAELDALKSNLSEKPNSCHHLLPAGYEFCTEEEAVKWVKVKLVQDGKNELPLGATVPDCTHVESLYRPIRPIQYHVAVHEAVTAEPTQYNLLLLADGRKFRISDKIRMADHDGMVLITPDSVDAVRYFNSGKLKPEYFGLPKIDYIEDIPNPYSVDWSNAPKDADCHAFDKSGKGWFYGVSFNDSFWYAAVFNSSGFTLPTGLDWKLSKTTRP
jgi:hypothetical protein